MAAELHRFLWKGHEFGANRWISRFNLSIDPLSALRSGGASLMLQARWLKTPADNLIPQVCEWFV
ncbi:hypothetical protein SynMITS9220_01526 [Synechococcus sp. MIT S9220]|nr:hypothetical protein SynMITS9220_01526 [Synechococcus sp. MIT S9220]